MPKKGKKGLDQRVKGNVKSASSQRMVELLGGDMSGVIGFDKVSSILYHADEISLGEMAGGMEVGEASMDVLHGGSQFQVVMKQLGKRDTTTKLKALQEFTVLTQQLHPSATIEILSLWSVMYTKLSMDNDNRVRDFTHKALNAVVVVVGPSLEIHLCSIMGCWVAGMCDPYAPSATSARAAFSAAFCEKQEVYGLMLEDLLSYVSVMVFKTTADTFSDPKMGSADECVQRYERALRMSVSSLKVILQQLSLDHLQKKQKLLQDFLSEKKLWALTKRQNPAIRAATFSIVPVICRRMPEFVQQKGKLFCSVVLGSLGEKESSVVGPVWEAASMILVNTETWQSKGSLEKVVLPGLWALLCAGGYGSAWIAYPCLLPVLQKLHQKVLCNDIDFAFRFLSKLRCGLSPNQPPAVYSEFEVQMKTFGECLVFLVTNSPNNLKFIKESFSLIMEDLGTGLSKGSSLTHSKIIFSAVAMIIGSLLQLQLQERFCFLKPLLSHLQLHISKIMSDILCEDVENNFSLVEALLSCFCGHAILPNMERRKEVHFCVSSTSESSSTEHPQAPLLESTTTTQEGVLSNKDVVQNFIAPTVCSLCGSSIATVSYTPHLLHSQLLLTMVRLYSNKSLIMAIFSTLESNYSILMKEHRGDRRLQQKLLIICKILTKAARVDKKGMVDHPEFCSNMIETMLVLIRSDCEDVNSIILFVSEYIKRSLSVFPLMLIKLSSTGQQDILKLVVKNTRSLYVSMFQKITEMASVYLWTLMKTLFSSTDSAFTNLDLAGPGFNTICRLLLGQLQDGFTLPDTILKSMLEVVGNATNSLMQEHMEGSTKLMVGLLHWTLFQRDRVELLREIVCCYRSLLSTYPDSITVIQSLPSLLIQDTTDNLLRSMVSASLYFTLHRDVVTFPEHLIGLYELLIRHVTTRKELWVPLSGLESFSNGSFLYSPCNNSFSTISSTSLPSSFHILLYPLFSLIKSSFLHELCAQTDSDVPEMERAMMCSLDELVEDEEVLVEVRALLFGGGGEGLKKSSREALDYIARTSLSFLPICVACLKDCILKKSSLLESCLREELELALGSCLEEAVSNRRHRWVKDLIHGLLELDTMGMDGPTITLTLNHIFVTLETCYVEDPEPLQGVIEFSLQSPECYSLYNAFCNMDKRLYGELVTSATADKQKDCGFFVFCLRILPHDLRLLHAASSCLGDVAKEQNDSKISIFESLSESAQDPLSFSVLELCRLLLARRFLSREAWDFVLCTLVSLMQMLCEAGMTRDLNLTIFICHMMRLCHDVAIYCSSVDCQGSLAVEWCDFFKPALQESLLSVFLNNSSTDSTLLRRGNPCLVLQHHQLCRTIVALSLQTIPEKDQFSELVDMVTSDFYPQQVASYNLCKWALGQYIIHKSDDEELAEGERKPFNQKDLLEVLGKAQGKINMDLVFMEDNSEEPQPLKGRQGDRIGNFHFPNAYRQTASYIFIWLLIVEVVRQCNAETRAIISDWLKELSLFDHFLHGLFKFLSDDSDKSTALSVTLLPSLEQLCFIAYSAVAKQLPSMLRQWHLTLDRQTSALVTKFTSKFISPELQQTDLQGISRSNTSVDNMEVRVFTGASEVAVTYKVDDFSIELFLCLPDCYPLQPPTIREGKRVKVEIGQWRKWMLQLTTFITNQNGSLLDGLLLWKSNLDKHFSGAEECMICFSVIHCSSYALPKMICFTCKKKFHSTCLYKWFKTSSKSSCPLCRNIF